MSLIDVVIQGVQILMSEKRDAVVQKIRELHQRLIDAYGEEQQDQDEKVDPVATLANTILSQNTNDSNRDLAYQQLRARFSTWEAVRDAPEKEVVEAIRPAGLAPTKGPRIQEALRTITEQQGEISLTFLRDMPLEEAKAWLRNLNGVGPKTASIVLLFALGRAAFPVDTHVHRVSKRLGLIPKTASREQAHDLLEDLVPQKAYYAFHLNLINHGRAICKARSPDCEACMLSDCCCYYQGSIK